MGRKLAVLLAMLVAWSGPAVGQDDGDRQVLARRIAERFDVLTVQGGVVLTPRFGNPGFRAAAERRRSARRNPAGHPGFTYRPGQCTSARLGTSPAPIQKRYINSRYPRLAFGPRG